MGQEEDRRFSSCFSCGHLGGVGFFLAFFGSSTRVALAGGKSEKGHDGKGMGRGGVRRRSRKSRSFGTDTNTSTQTSVAILAGGSVVWGVD